MPKLNGNSEKKQSHRLVAKFSRCMRYPAGEDEFEALADGLEKASRIASVEMLAIVDACLLISQFCPTDAELLTVARNIRDERKREFDAKQDKTREWRQQYGNPESYDWKAEAAKIMPQHMEFKAKETRMLALMRDKARERHMPLHKMGQLEFLRLQVDCQRIAGIEVTPEQERETR